MSTTITHASTEDHDRWDGAKRYIRIVIHDTTDELQRAAKRYRGEDFSNAGGLFHPADTVYTVMEDGTFAYIAGHLIARVTSALHDAGAWS